MNKEGIKKFLKDNVKLDDSKINAICDVLEKNILAGNKDKIISTIISKTGIDEKTANDVYNKAMSAATGSLKDKLKNPFGN